MKKAILLASICILASILIFETSKFTARKNYHVEEAKDENIEFSAEAGNSIDALDDLDAENADTEMVTDGGSIDIEPAEDEVGEKSENEELSGNLDLDITKDEKTEIIEDEKTEITEVGEDTSDIEEPESVENGDSDISNAENSSESRMLVFLDAYKESHQAEIDPLVKPHDYELPCFVNDGTFTRYIGDDRYSYRLGVDVSHHDGEIDFKAVKEAGIDFVILRIGYRGYGSEGTLNEDRMFRTYIDGAHEAGLDVGCYIFSQAINTDEAREEAQLCLDILKDYKIELPVVYDPESILNANARTDYVSGEQFTENTITFCEMIKEAGYQPMIYSNMMWEAFEFDLKKLSDYPIWYADYEPLPQTPYNFEYWQYSNTGRVPGISEMVDLDIQLIKN